MKDKPNYTRCSVCHTVGINDVGSTACCGGISESLYREEVEALGIDPDTTRNADIIRPEYED